MTEEKEISLTKDGIVIKGNIVDDVRKPIKRLSDTADTFLRLVDNIVGLPADFISTHLETFRTRYKEEYDAIPEGKVISPKFKIGCSVLKNVAYSAEEQELQELFAKLLASASNTDTYELVHPAFASILNEMTSLDARVLKYFYDNEESFIGIESTFSDNEKHVNIHKNVSNLVRVGIIYNKDPIYSEEELREFIGRRGYTSLRSDKDISNALANLINDVQDLKNNIIRDRKNISHRSQLRLTPFGDDFVKAVLY